MNIVRLNLTSVIFNRKDDLEYILKIQQKLFRKNLGPEGNDVGCRLEFCIATEKLSNLAAWTHSNTPTNKGSCKQQIRDHNLGREKEKYTVDLPRQTGLSESPNRNCGILRKALHIHKVHRWSERSEIEIPKRQGTKWAEENGQLKKNESHTEDQKGGT